MQESTTVDWDDLRHLLSLARAGSLARAARELGVDHTTVGRRVDAAERALGVRLFTRGPSGYALTEEGRRVLEPLTAVESAVRAVRLAAQPDDGAWVGRVRVTSPETFGIAWLAPVLGRFALTHPGMQVDLVPSGAVLDLSRGEAEIAVRFFRARDPALVARRVGRVTYGLYAPPGLGGELAHMPFVLPPDDPPAAEVRWVKSLVPAPRIAFTSELSLALLQAARAGAGATVLPRYLGDAEPGLVRIEVPDPPSDVIWLTVHEDLRANARVRAAAEFVEQALRADRERLEGLAASGTNGAG